MSLAFTSPDPAYVSPGLMEVLSLHSSSPLYFGLRGAPGLQVWKEGEQFRRLSPTTRGVGKQRGDLSNFARPCASSSRENWGVLQNSFQR